MRLNWVLRGKRLRLQTFTEVEGGLTYWPFHKNDTFRAKERRKVVLHGL